MPVLSILMGKIETSCSRLFTGCRARLHQLAICLRRAPIWLILPGRVPTKIVLPRRLASLLLQRAKEFDQPLEVLLAGLLSVAVSDSRPPDLVDQAWRQLTEREREVASLMSQGLSNRAIAARLMVSRNTVRTHAQRVLRKFGCRSRAELPVSLADKLP
jgi:DNA-binding CsgD family transcriptional regulator